MKKWISYIIMSALLITALPLYTAKAAETDCTGTLTANGNNIDVSLSVPQAATENITSLHFRVDVSIESGKMDAPLFQFADTIKSEVKDSKVTSSNPDNSSYIIDIILSGKKDKVIFPESGKAGIGTISLKPSGSTYKILTNFTGLKEDDTNPAAEYVTDNGYTAQEVSLIDTQVITVEKKETDTKPVISSSAYAPAATATKEPEASASPSAEPSGTPKVTASPLPGDTTEATTGPGSATDPSATPVPSAEPTGIATPEVTPGVTEPDTTEPSVTTGSFDTTLKPSMSASLIKGSCNVKLKWNVAEGADGYIIYSTAKQSGKYKKLKTISKPDKTSCNVHMNYASTYSFKMRAFKTAEDGSKVFSQYSSVKKVTTAPAKLKGLKAKFSGNKVNLSWKKVKNADGYMVYASKKQNKGYSLVKTIKKGSVIKTNVKKSQKTNYFKVRAYVKNTAGKRVHGNFSTVKKATY